jgi:DNA modification methylase
MKYVDETEKLNDLVQFNSNRYLPNHRWYNLTEGFSRELVRRIIGEQKKVPKACLDPFGGVGTTSLTCQELGIRCYSIESSPFFYDVAKTKLETRYEGAAFEKLILDFEAYLKACKANHEIPDLESETFFQYNGNKKWIFNKPVANAILDITSRIKEIERGEDELYAGLFKIALASQLVSVSNVYRNGKCLTYRNSWQDIKISRKEVHQRFLAHCKEVLLLDIRTNQLNLPKVENGNNLYNGDSREHIRFIPDNSVDLVITSPPYLNSRDYTDIYRLELWMLGYVTKFAEEKIIRKSALTSHVQVQLEHKNSPNIPELNRFLRHLARMNGSLWNKNIPNMVKGYFADMNQLLTDMHPKLRPGAMIYINVSNSAYVGQIIEVDTILAKMSESLGFKAHEIRTARHVNSSNQQQLQLDERLRESVIVLEKVR